MFWYPTKVLQNFGLNGVSSSFLQDYEDADPYGEGGAASESLPVVGDENGDFDETGCLLTIRPSEEIRVAGLMEKNVQQYVQRPNQTVKLEVRKVTAASKNTFGMHKLRVCCFYCRVWHAIWGRGWTSKAGH